MERLKEIIGKAPSEMTKEELMERVRKERKRVSTALDAYSYSPPSKKKKTKKPKLAKSTKEMLAELGLTEEEFLAAKEDLGGGNEPFPSASENS